jgi:DNA-binding transcriptional MocR family regulator
MRWLLGHLAKRTIGPDKVNQLRHARFLPDAGALREHMRAHRRLLAPKFELVDRVLRERLGDTGTATWSRPEGGYFVSLDVADGCAARAVRLAVEAGVALTPAGATFPYGMDARDRTLPIAPTFPPLEELAQALEGLVASVLLAGAERS